MSSARGRERRADVRPADAERDARRRKTAMNAVAVRRQRRHAVGEERDAERVERALVLGDASSGRRAAARSEASSPIADAEGEAEPDVLEHEASTTMKSLVVEPQRGGEREHRRQREPVVEARLEVQRVADRAAARAGSSRRSSDSTGSVGDSSAPTQEALRPATGRSARLAPARRSPRSSASPIASLRSGRCHARLEHLALDLEPVAEQDHDQRDDRERRRRTPSAGRSRAPRARRARARTRRATNSAVSDRKLRCAIPDSSAPPTSSAPSTTTAVSKACTADRVSQQSDDEGHRPGQVALLAGRRRGVQRLPGRGGRHAPADGLRQRRLLASCAATATTSTSTRS